MKSSSKNKGPVREKQVRVEAKGIDLLSLTGPRDINLRFLEKQFSGTLVVRDDALVITGDDHGAADVQKVLVEMVERVRHGQLIDEVTVSYLWDRISSEEGLTPADDSREDPILFASSSRLAVRAKTAGQQKYVDAVRQDDVVFAIGPAGTGKTYLAVVMAMDYLKRQLVDRIILVRPAVEAGEQLGFLPGDLQDKINPYLRPLFDALSDITGAAKISRYLASGVIEASPLAYMRGRTLNNAFVILDEAQNTTVGQMKMFLTRLGFQSKAVITGDITQIDLHTRDKSGLVHVQEILGETEGVSFVDLDGADIVRHPLVRRIVDAFEAAGVESENL
ncbi:MAG: PhoH family protein [bacterium]|nr:PhoH family protein [bacterium]